MSVAAAGARSGLLVVVLLAIGAVALFDLVDKGVAIVGLDRERPAEGLGAAK